jgi:hypothetical protein
LEDCFELDAKVAAGLDEVPVLSDFNVGLMVHLTIEDWSKYPQKVSGGQHASVIPSAN